MTGIVTVLDEGLGNSSYVVDIGDRRALVLDPERDPGWYLAAAEHRGLRVAYTVETHLHADLPVYPTHGAGSFCSVLDGGPRDWAQATGRPLER